MSKEAQVPESELKQRTPKGHEIPVPKREDIKAAFRKIVGPAKPLKKS